MLLAGGWTEREATVEVRDPGDGSLVDTVPRAGVEDADAALEAAEAAAPEARKRPVHERMRVLHATADAVEGDGERYARTLAREGIKTLREARKEVARSVDTLRLSAEEARRLEGRTVPFDQSPGSESKVGYWRPEPVGIVVAITPFNDPLNLVAHKVGPALAAGNVVILKPDSRTPLSALALAEALLASGLPETQLQVLTGPGSSVGRHLVQDPRPRLVSFTGGRLTGERIARDAGLKKISMELGSNAPALVLPDADLEPAVQACVSGAYAAAGQNCLHVQRVLVHADLAEAFRERFVAAATAVRTGPKLDEATDMGPLIDEGAARRVERLVHHAVEAGATLWTGGERDGAYLAPTVLSDVPPDVELAREEIYGPVTVLSTFQREEDAIREANDVPYGLQAGVFTRDVRAAFRVSDALHYGGVMINESSDYRIDAMPFGGFKGSGLGREGVPFTVHEMTEPKLVCFDLA